MGRRRPARPVRDAVAAIVTQDARAKVNLTLRVLGRRADDYHLLQSLVVFPALADRLVARAADDLTLDLAGPFAAALAGGPNGEDDNLVLRAARVLRREAGVVAGAHLTLEKNLPVASGIGGGSADAAATLRILSRLWNVTMDEAALAEIATTLGADVAVCLSPRPALMWGIGERIARLDALPPFWLLLANPGIALATKAVFRELAAPRFSAMQKAPPHPAFASLDALLAWLAREGNDLERPAKALAPEVGQVLAALGATQGCRLARMSGSGATCFGLYADERAAREAARVLGAAHAGWWLEAAPVNGSG